MGLFDFLKGNKKAGNDTTTHKSLLEKTTIIPGLKVPKAIATDWDAIGRLKIPFS